MSVKLSDFGHRLLVEPSGTILTAAEREILKELKPLSFIFRARNFGFRAPYKDWLAQFSDLLSDIRSCVGEEKLLLSIDHEGGRVIRPPLPITRFPYAASWGDQVEEVAKAMAIELKSIGLNTSWAPVADVLTNPTSKAIGKRAFSENTAEVIEKSLLMTKALESHGVAAGIKHFPGYGPVTEDAHFDLPTADISLDEWERIHLPPFKRLIDEGVRMIMTAHIKYPVLDKVDQATLSKPILVDILRKRLGFKGVVVADALGMGAIRDEIESIQTVVKALQAEMDLFCIAGDAVDLTTAKTLAELMKKSVIDKLVSKDLMDNSKRRIQSLIARLPQHLPQPLELTIFENHGALAHQLDPNNEWKLYQYIPAGFD